MCRKRGRTIGKPVLAITQEAKRAMKQAEDFREEVRALAQVLEPLQDADFDRVTLFQDWTIGDVLGHLHMFDVAALETLKGAEHFAAFFAPIARGLAEGRTLRETQYPWLGALAGRALFEAWRVTGEKVADAYGMADPKRRVQWAGPEMSALSAITARQMETWAHGQEVFDVLGLERAEGDRIRNICHLGVSTRAWTFANRGLPVPEPAPHVRLVAPSGAVWEWNDPQEGNRVEGSAVGFARTVTQVRNVTDTDIRATGPGAAEWMRLAQCFAGDPVEPPAPGSRYRAGA